MYIRYMFLPVNHTKLNVYHASRELLKECYRVTGQLPQHERFILVQQIRRAALSVILNIAEGASRKSIMERKRFFEISRGSIVEIDAATEIIKDLEYLQLEKMEKLGLWLNKCFSMLCKMITQ